MHPGIFLCTPLVYSHDNWVKKRAHIGRTCAKNVRPALEMCAPGAECTVNFEHCLYTSNLLTLGSHPEAWALLQLHWLTQLGPQECLGYI